MKISNKPTLASLMLTGFSIYAVATQFNLSNDVDNKVVLLNNLTGLIATEENMKIHSRGNEGVSVDVI